MDGKVRLFRPQKHIERMNNSARRLNIPPLDPELALRSLVELVGLDREWVPKTIGTSLYVRPVIMAISFAASSTAPFSSDALTPMLTTIFSIRGTW